jgi:hypothetical protein
MNNYNYLNTKDNSYQLNNYRKLTPTYHYYDTDKTYDGPSLKYNKHYNTYLTPEEKETLDRTIYPITTKEKASYFYRKAILFTEIKPTKEQIANLKKPQFTIIYTPNPETATICNLTHRISTTRAKAINLIIYNQPTTVTFQYMEYNTDPYKTSIANAQKQLSTHGTHVKLIDLTHDYTLVIPPCASGTETIITEPNWLQYQATLQPYRDYLKENPTIYSRKTESTVCQDILDYINIWASAYDIQLPDTKQSYTEQQTQLLTIYNQLKSYEHYQLPVNDSHTLCPFCNKPYPASFIDNFLPCPHCEQLDQDLIDEDYKDYVTDYTWPTKTSNRIRRELYPEDPQPEPTAHVTPLSKRPTYLDNLHTPTTYYYELADIYIPLWNAIANNDLD